MTARADTCVFMDETPHVRVHLTNDRGGHEAPRAAMAIDPVLTIFAPVDVLRATLVAALAQIDALEAGR